jgi:hypothetical protein
MKTTFLRATIRSAPDPIVVAERPINVSVWVCSERSAEGAVAANGIVRLSTHLRPENDWHAPALPFNAFTPKFRLETGETLYAISNDEAEIGILIEEID